MRRRNTALLGVALVLATGGAYVGHRLSTGGEVTEVGVDEALDRYREQAGSTSSALPSTTPATPPPAPQPSTEPSPTTASPVTPSPEPTVGTDAVTTTTEPVVASLVAPGVYQYATTGFDRVDVLTGAQHDYPEITTITVVPYDCGVRLRWDVAVERWDTWDWCLEGNAIRQTGWVGYHEFFGQAGRQDNTCDGDPRPLDAPPGTTWTMTCRMGDRTASVYAGTVLGRETLTVAGAEVPVLHVRYEVEVTGESTGTQTVEGWYRTTDGLPVREQLSISTRQDTVVGTTNFEEQYTIELLTPTPLA